jgi:hypothetical protein
MVDVILRSALLYLSRHKQLRSWMEASRSPGLTDALSPADLDRNRGLRKLSASGSSAP